MIHINTQPNNIYMTTHKHEYHPHETKEQLYDVELHEYMICVHRRRSNVIREAVKNYLVDFFR